MYLGEKNGSDPLLMQGLCSRYKSLDWTCSLNIFQKILLILFMLSWHNTNKDLMTDHTF